MNTEVTDVLPEDEYEPTPLEALLDRIIYLRNLIDTYKGKLSAQFLLNLRALEEEARKWFDVDGNPIPVVDPTEPLEIQFSPAEAATATGWWTFTPSNFGKLPRWFRNRSRHVTMGLELSQSRINGAFLIRNLQTTAEAWLKNDTGNYEGAKAWANYYSARRGGGSRCSARVLFLAAHIMVDQRYMFPTWNRPGADGLEGYALNPDIPFNEDERNAWSELFQDNHLRAAIGGSKLRDNLRAWPITFNGSLFRDHVADPNGKQQIYTVANHPNWVVPAACAWYNSGDFKRDFYYSAQRLAYAIDHGDARVEGYRTPEEFGYEEADGSMTAWYARYESHGGNRIVYLPEGRSEFV